MNGYVTVEQAASVACKSPNAIRYMCKSGKLRFKLAVPPGKQAKKRFVRVDDIGQVDGFLESTFILISTLAEEYGVVPQTLYALIGRGHVRWVRLGGQLHVHRADYDEYYSRNRGRQRQRQVS